MADKFLNEKISVRMSRVKHYDTPQEKAVRSLLHRMGYRFRLHVKVLPGNPDIVLPRHKKVIFVHGCFWHGHKGCRRSTRPKSNVDFWNAKIDGNIKRDVRVRKEFKKLGWKTLVVWECQLKDLDKLCKKLNYFVTK